MSSVAQLLSDSHRLLGELYGITHSEPAEVVCEHFDRATEFAKKTHPQLRDINLRGVC